MPAFTIQFFKDSSITPEKVEGGYFGDFESAERYADSRRHEIGCRSYDVREKTELSHHTKDISTIKEYGLTQKLSNSIRCF